MNYSSSMHDIRRAVLQMVWLLLVRPVHAIERQIGQRFQRWAPAWFARRAWRFQARFEQSLAWWLNHPRHKTFMTGLSVSALLLNAMVVGIATPWCFRQFDNTLLGVVVAGAVGLVLTLNGCLLLNGLSPKSHFIKETARFSDQASIEVALWQMIHSPEHESLRCASREKSLGKAVPAAETTPTNKPRQRF